MAEIKSNGLGAAGIGQVQIADEVIAVIAGTAVMEVAGVAALAGNLTGDIAVMLGRKNLSKGVTVDVDGENVTVSISLTVKLGYKIQETVLEVQKKVKTAIETMTGLTVPTVNINVSGVNMDKEKSKESKELKEAKELKESQANEG